MPNFTPGPWEVDAPDTLQIRTAIPYDEPTYVAGLYAHGYGNPNNIAYMYSNGKIDHVAEANARLIAAAPDMYMAICQCLDFIEDIIALNCDCSLSLDAEDLREPLENLLKRIHGEENNV